MSKHYVLSVNILVEGAVDDIFIQNEIEDILEKSLEESQYHSNAEIVSVQIDDISKNTNYGRCVICRDWASDKRQKDSVSQFSNGAKIDDQWYCDICLPKNHPSHF